MAMIMQPGTSEPSRKENAKGFERELEALIFALLQYGILPKIA